jgi:hypothetical protein
MDTERRNFLKNTVVTAGMMGLGSLGTFFPAAAREKNSAVAKTEVKGVEEPVFRFLHVNDLHVQSPLARSLTSEYGGKIGETYAEANTRAFWLLEALTAGAFFPKIDFVLMIGDLIYGEGLEGLKLDFDFFNSFLYKRFPVPCYPAVGNHENVQKERDPVYEAPYRQTFGEDKVDYSFVHKGIHFIVFNNSGTACIREPERLQERAEKLKQMLDEHPALPKILCCHVPLIPVRREEVLAKSFGFSSYNTVEPEILQLAEAHSDKVLAVLSGHLHLSGVAVHRTIYQVVTSGLASYPHDMAIYSVYTDRIDVEFIQAPSDLLTPSTNIHGASRFGHDFTDDQHPEYTSYLMGNASERRFSIPLK